ncbi:hinge domain of cleavage stimulation factor subunit 2-domain-containing protein [Daldinia caldariorum]|uniref:hinge domain of cleavage stimulation factor subunit 2-domain-containing protein n=1 Tax=Daldinia caldariorum TaxID=326644 RepID=UPI002008A96F|nr:hinge domain of cleavage stimulation factor subunit 2-domain-containing protein [Daldinia caldariorum]KAI1465693.1 hinge domain of cleavage stimulation factor subunit 2-domain-containing protein [Daldinia caldariorum]
MSTKQPSRVVFVGNIPYGLSEEQITDIFSTAGKVLNFRLVYDRDTGRPKGFGFAEYPDADSAASAVRNLNDYEIMGRKLRVDYSTEGRVDGDDSNSASTTTGQPANGASYIVPQPAPTGSILSLPPGKELPAGVSATDAISRTLNTLPPSQLLDILSQMKSLATTDPNRATELLQQAPQLSYAIFQALLLMGLVSPEAIHSVVDSSAAPPPVQQPVPGFPPAYTGATTVTPPVAVAYAPPASVAAPQAAYAPPAASAPVAAAPQDTEALMQAVMNLSQEMIDQLPETERQQILALRAGMMAQRR